MAAVAMPAELVFSSISLPSKPDAPIRYAYVAPPPGPAPTALVEDTLLVFLNGLLVPQAGWHPAIAMLLRERKLGAQNWWPAMLTYDRFGQGQTTSKDPLDEGREAGYGHDVSDVVDDLDVLIQHISQVQGISPKRLVFVANSIGCAVARLYAQRFENRVCGMLLLDSIMANSDFVSMFPDPDAPAFDASKLPEGVTVEALRDTRRKFREIFHPSVVNPEGLDRRNLAKLLPSASEPRLGGLDGKGPLLLVVGHDPVWFAQLSEEGSMATPVLISMNYTNPTWHAYNEGLVQMTQPQRYLTADKAPFIAPKCGHFIQRDDPLLVSQLIDKLLLGIVDTFDTKHE